MFSYFDAALPEYDARTDMQYQLYSAVCLGHAVKIDNLLRYSAH